MAPTAGQISPELAWRRTGLTACRVVPAVDQEATAWPYTAVGAAFAVYGVFLFVRGTQQAGERRVEAPLRRDLVLAAAGPLLGLLVIALSVTA